MTNQTTGGAGCLTAAFAKPSGPYDITVESIANGYLVRTTFERPTYYPTLVEVQDYVVMKLSEHFVEAGHNTNQNHD